MLENLQACYMRKGYLSINQDIIATNSLSKDVKNTALVATLAKK